MRPPIRAAARGGAVAFSLPIGLTAGAAAACVLAVLNEGAYVVHMLRSRLRVRRAHLTRRN